VAGVNNAVRRRSLARALMACWYLCSGDTPYPGASPVPIFGQRRLAGRQTVEAHKGLAQDRVKGHDNADREVHERELPIEAETEQASIELYRFT
jgi:hypothetical protein